MLYNTQPTGLRAYAWHLYPVVLVSMLATSTVAHATENGVAFDATVAEETEETLEVDFSDVPLLRTVTISNERDSRSLAGPPQRGLTQRERNQRSGETWETLLHETPGVTMRSAGPATQRPVLRGLDGERILVLEDGQRMGDLSGTAADHAIAVDPLSVVAMEVIRGPAAVLYGGSALGGVINLRRSSLLDGWPTAPELSLRLGASSVDRGLGGSIRGATHHHDFAFAVHATGRLSGDLQTAEGRLPDTSSASGEVGSDIGWRQGAHEGELRVLWRTHTFGIPEAWDDDDERVELRMQRLRLSHEWILRPDNGLLRQLRHTASITGYRHDEIEIEDGEEELELSFDKLSHSQRLELSLRPEPTWLDETLLGLDLDVETLRIGGEEVLSPDADRVRTGAFVMQSLRASDRVTFPVGVRLESTLVTTRSNDAFEAGPRRHFMDVGASAGVLARPTRGVELGAQATRAFRAPLVEELASDAPHLGAGAYEIGDPDLGSEVTHGGDLWGTLTTSVFDLELSGFLSTTEGFITREPTGETDLESGLPFFIYRGTRAILVGAEASSTLRLPASLELKTGIDLVRGAESSFDGTPLASMPPTRARARLGWFPVDTFVWVDALAIATQRRLADAEDRTPGTVLLGATLGHRFFLGGGVLTAALRLDNLTNAAWRDHLSQVERRGTAQAGRSVALTVAGAW